MTRPEVAEMIAEAIAAERKRVARDIAAVGHATIASAVRGLLPGTSTGTMTAGRPKPDLQPEAIDDLRRALERQGSDG